MFSTKSGLINNFANGFISPEFGLLPTVPPALGLPDAFAELDLIADSIQIWVRDKDLNAILAVEKKLKANNRMQTLLDALSDSELARVKVILGSCAHAYAYLVNENPGDTHAVDVELPALFEFWKQVSEKMGQGSKPVLTIGDAAYYNWRYKSSDTPHTLDNLRDWTNLQRLVPVFNNNEDNISNLGMIVFEAHFAPAVKAIDLAIQCVESNDQSLLAEQLDIICNAVQDITRELPNLFNLRRGGSNYIDLETWTKTYIKFVKRSYAGEPNLAGFADTFFYVLEAFLGREIYESNLGKEMQHTEEALQVNHRAFISQIKRAAFRNYIASSNNETLKRKFQFITEVYAGKHGFLGVHKSLAMSITVLGSQSRPATNGGNKLDTSIGEQLERSRAERRNKALENVFRFVVKSQKPLITDENYGHTFSVQLVMQDESQNAASYLRAGTCISIPIKNSQESVEEIKRLLASMNPSINFNLAVDLSKNTAWSELIANGSDQKITLETLLYHADLTQLRKKLATTEVNLERDLVPAPERTYSVSSVEGATVTLIIKRQVYNDGSVGAGSSYLTNPTTLGQVLTCRILPPVTFTLPRNNNKPVLLIASANGISPFLHFLAELNQANAAYPVYLVYMTREENPAWLKEKIREFTQLSNLKICIISTKDQQTYWISKDECNSQKLNCRFSVVQNVLTVLRKANPDIQIYICGGVPFVKDIMQVLRKQLGEATFSRFVGNSLIVSEAFSFANVHDFAVERSTGASMRADVTFSLEEVQQHDSAQSCWVTVEGEVFDVTPFLNLHPGGSDIFTSRALFNRDIGALFRSVHSGSSAAEGWLHSYHIGHIKQETTPSVAASCPVSVTPQTMPKSCPFASREVFVASTLGVFAAGKPENSSPNTPTFRSQPNPTEITPNKLSPP